MDDAAGNDWYGTAHEVTSQPQYFTDLDSKAQVICEGHKDSEELYLL